MIIDNCNAWAVRVTFPPGSLDKDKKPRRWAHNDTITVVADGIARAQEMVRAQWPDATIWSINHVGSRTILMIDTPAAAVVPLAPLSGEAALRATEGSGAALARAMGTPVVAGNMVTSVPGAMLPIERKP